ncbi:hypothetical protein [Streptomyces sp. NBC_00076]|uniref:hypothetical protein n=1 Tax=Streptomyces sp. NBC_00076 TaxID=2975642 RepID=UPI0038644DDA
MGAWRYPHQLHGWEPVAGSGRASWALPTSFTFVIGRGRPVHPEGVPRDRSTPSDLQSV